MPGKRYGQVLAEQFQHQVVLVRTMECNSVRGVRARGFELTQPERCNGGHIVCRLFSDRVIARQVQEPQGGLRYAAGTDGRNGVSQARPFRQKNSGLSATSPRKAEIRAVTRVASSDP